MSNVDSGQRPQNRTRDCCKPALTWSPAHCLSDRAQSPTCCAPHSQPVRRGGDATEIRHCLCLFLLLLVLPGRNPCIQMTANYSEISLHPLTARSVTFTLVQVFVGFDPQTSSYVLSALTRFSFNVLSSEV